MAELMKYGVEDRIYFPLVGKADTDFIAGVTIAAGDATISKDGGAWASIVGESDDDLFVDEDNGLYSIKVAIAELQCKRAVIRIVDLTDPKEWEDQMILIDTYGNASAQHAFDLDTAEQTVDAVKISGSATAADNLETAALAHSATRGLAGTALPDAAADAAGGLPISDTGGLDLDALITNQGTIDTKLDAIAGYIDTEISSMPADVVTAMLAATGVTAGGTWTFAEAMILITAWAGGDWQEKSGVAGTQEVIDPDDGSTVIAEVVVDTDSPYKTVTIL